MTVLNNILEIALEVAPWLLGSLVSVIKNTPAENE